MRLRARVASQLRRWAQRLSPLLTEKQITDLRDYYDNHCAVTGEPIQRFGLTLNVNDYDKLGEALERINKAERDAWRNGFTSPRF